MGKERKLEGVTEAQSRDEEAGEHLRCCSLAMSSVWLKRTLKKLNEKR